MCNVLMHTLAIKLNKTVAAWMAANKILNTWSNTRKNQMAAAR